VLISIPINWANGVPAAATTYSATAGAGYNQAQIQALMNQVTLLTTTLNLVLAGERTIQT
jgi:hypothetical protein